MIFSRGNLLAVRLFFVWGFCASWLPDAKAQEARTLDFQGLQNGEQVFKFYNGGLGSRGSGPGPAYGVTFEPDANQRVTLLVGESILLSNTDLQSTAITMNVDGGFWGQVAFRYATPLVGGVRVTIYDGLKGTGAILAQTTLPPAGGIPVYNTSSNPVTRISFGGTGRSVRFQAALGVSQAVGLALDNITLEPGSMAGLTSLTTSLGALYPGFRPEVTAYTDAETPLAEGSRRVAEGSRRVARNAPSAAREAGGWSGRAQGSRTMLSHCPAAL